tara:strand:- start:71 stop:550 length:480 start_codon:yes stop_codon:yes gene_type:complete
VTKKIILISGAFDTIHLGQLLLLKHASSYGKVIVALNSDEWIINKKGFTTFDFETRKRLLEDIPYVHKIIEVDDGHDGTVCSAMLEIRPDFFGNGGSATSNSIPKAEIEVCEYLGIEPVFGLGDTENDAEDQYLITSQDKILRYSVEQLEKIDKIKPQI